MTEGGHKGRPSSLQGPRSYVAPVQARLATAADVKPSARALAEAFAGDAPMRWFLKGVDDKPELLRGFFEEIIDKLYFPLGRVWVTDEPAGAALWAPPGRFPFSTREQAPTLPTLLRVFGRRPIRAFAGNHAITKGHPHEPHWHLEYIGVEAAGQGRGAGTALLAPMLEHCDAEREAAHLNAGSPQSKRLYERNGFVATEMFKLPVGGPPLWRMWREPR